MSENSRRPSRGPMGRGRMSGEKAKDFSGAVKKLLRYMSKYKIRLIGMMIFAIAGTVFNIVGPKILGKATTELFNGLVAKVNETGGIDFDKIGRILLWTLGLYLCSAGIFLHPGIYHDGNLQRCQLLPAKRHFRENEPAADEVLRKPDLLERCSPESPTMWIPCSRG